ncbi:hypothetical protein Tco_0357102 [Tanacetum coccineum]
MGRDTIKLENAVSTITQEYLPEFTSEYGIPEGFHPEFPGPEDTIVDFLEGYYQIHISQLSVIGAAKVSHFEIACRVLNVAPTLALFCVFYVPSYNSEMDLFNLISTPNPSKVKTGIRPCVAHEVPLLTVTADRVIEMKDPSVASGSSGTPSTVERSPLDFDNENPAPVRLLRLLKRPCWGRKWPQWSHLSVKGESNFAAKRGNEEVEVNASPKVLRRDHASGPTQSTTGGKSLASMRLEAGIPIHTSTPQEIPTDVSDPDPLSYLKPQSVPEQDMAQSSKGASVAGDP